MDLADALKRLPSDDAVALRPWGDEDVDALAAAGADPEIQRWTLVPDAYTRDDAVGFVAWTRQARAAGVSCELAVVDAADRARVLGSVGLVRIEWDLERAEVGYWTAPEARRRGVAQRAIRLLSRWAFDELPLARLQLTPFAENTGSLRVAERAGYTREGVLRRSYRSKAGLVDVVMFSMLRDERP
jgi:RimJ/RimL family protein N-acetyltransferase